MQIYLEAGQKKVLAAALDWPGWCRAGKDEGSVLDAFVQAAPRYAQIVKPAGFRLAAPGSATELAVVERAAGGAATDMGVPAVVLERDSTPMGEAELARSMKILQACWDAFDRTVEAARGKELRKGPRGGGRELDAMVRHVAESEAGYARAAGGQFDWNELVKTADLQQALAASREKVLEALAAAAPIGVPPPGPRGGARWPARYSVRRVAYHVVDHIWEIEDRLQPYE